MRSKKQPQLRMDLGLTPRTMAVLEGLEELLHHYADSVEMGEPPIDSRPFSTGSESVLTSDGTVIENNVPSEMHEDSRLNETVENSTVTPSSSNKVVIVKLEAVPTGESVKIDYTSYIPSSLINKSRIIRYALLRLCSSPDLESIIRVASEIKEDALRFTDS